MNTASFASPNFFSCGGFSHSFLEPYFAPMDTSQAVASSPPCSKLPSHKGRVLLVDDEPQLLKAYARMLQAQGYEVETASDGAEAIEKFSPGNFHAVLSDITMPSMTGLQLLRAVRERDLDVPFILITGEPSVDTAIPALDYGALRYLVKPVDPEELKSVVEHAVQMHRMAVMKRQALKLLGEGNRQIGDRAGLEVRFESALDKLFMVYQPIVRWSDRTVHGYETLVRSRESTMPHPGALFGAAERIGRVQELNQAIRRVAPLPMVDASERGRLFFNLHVMDLNDDSLFDEDSPLAKMADRVVLELTERATLDQVNDARGRVAKLREMGFSIAVDDLGAGYAGLSSFALLEPDVVKLDMALVRDIDSAPTKRKLVRSLVELCADMGLAVVAEGVETAEEHRALVDLGCDLFQGYHFARPAAPFTDVNWPDANGAATSAKGPVGGPASVLPKKEKA